jgi:DNA-binding MarR family transcriptional regulator
MNEEILKLENQICFPLYAASRLVTKLYQPVLSQWDITYPQYLVFLLLWERDKRTVTDIGECLVLESSTLTPLLKRLETKGYISRIRSAADERNVLIELTEKGKALQEEASQIPELVINSVKSTTLTEADVIQLKQTLDTVVKQLK